MSFKEQLVRVRQIKVKYEAHLLQKANVVGVGVGLWMPEGSPTPEPAIIVNVTHKVPLLQLAPEDRLPSLLEDVPVQVQAVGKLKVQ